MTVLRDQIAHVCAEACQGLKTTYQAATAIELLVAKPLYAMPAGELNVLVDRLAMLFRCSPTVSAKDIRHVLGVSILNAQSRQPLDQGSPKDAVAPSTAAYIVQGFGVYCHPTTGRRNTKPIEVYLEEHLAKADAASRAKGDYSYQVDAVTLMVVSDGTSQPHYYLLVREEPYPVVTAEQKAKQLLRKNALAKLTEAEIAELNIELTPDDQIMAALDKTMKPAGDLRA